MTNTYVYVYELLFWKIICILIITDTMCMNTKRIKKTLTYFVNWKRKFIFGCIFAFNAFTILILNNWINSWKLSKKAKQKKWWAKESERIKRRKMRAWTSYIRLDCAIRCFPSLFSFNLLHETEWNTEWILFCLGICRHCVARFIRFGRKKENGCVFFFSHFNVYIWHDTQYEYTLHSVNTKA